MNGKLLGALLLAISMMASTLSMAASARTVVICSGPDLHTNLPKIDMSAWKYNKADDVYYQTGLTYCENPADKKYETMGFYVPGAYFDGTRNKNGTYTCQKNTGRTVAGYNALTAPVILPVNTPGYAAMAAPTGYPARFGYGSVSDYTKAGMVVIVPGARGRDHGAPAGVVDFKAAIRYARYNADLLPGDVEHRLFTEGMSGGGAQSALLGATGDDKLYEPYLKAIGAVDGPSDAVTGSMCWCPVTNLDLADEAYEWNMGMSRTGLTAEQQRLSNGMAEAFGPYVNRLHLHDENGAPLFLENKGDGIYQSGPYYDYILRVAEQSLENFLQDTTFPYTVPNAMQNMVDNIPSGFSLPTELLRSASFEDLDKITRNGAKAGVTLKGTYATKEDYIAALNANGKWVSYDAATGRVKFTSLADFSHYQKPATKNLGAFDQLDRGQGENTLFGFGDGTAAHFDLVLGTLVKGTEYESAFAADLARKDALGTDMATRVNMYNPLYYLCRGYDGFGTSKPAKFWRIRSGITQGDTALTTEANLALCAKTCAKGQTVDFATVWGQGHTMAERSGGNVENFIAWVNQCTATL